MFCLYASRLPAATLIWTGAAGNGLIGTGGNWNLGLAPAPGDLLVFGGITSLGPQLASGLTVGSLSFATGAGAFTLGGAGTYTINTSAGVTNNSTSTQTINNALTLGSAQTWSASAGNLIFGGNLANAGFGLTIAGGFNTSIAGVVSGAGGLTETGTGTLTLSGANTYSGLTTVSAGALRISHSSALGTTAGGTTVGSGAALELSGNIAVGAETITSLNGSGIANGGALRNISGNNSWAGNISLENVAVIRINSDAGTLTLNGNISEIGGSTKVLTFGGAGNVTVNGTIVAVGGDLGLSKDGTGTLTLANANSYNQATTLSGGILLLTHATALPGGIGTAGGNTALTISGGGIIGLGAGDFSRGLGTGSSQVQFTGSGGFAAFGADRNVNLGGASTQVTWGTGSFVPTGSDLILGAAGADRTVFFQNPIALGAVTRTVQVNNGSAGVDAYLTGVLSGTGGLTKTGTGTLTLSGVNTYSGGTTLNAGTLAVNSAASLGVSSGSLILNAGTLEVTTGHSTSRTISLGNAASTFQIDPSQTFTVTSAIGGSGALNKTGTGTMLLTAANTYSGGTVISSGTLALGSDSGGNQNAGSLGSGAVTIAGGQLRLGGTGGAIVTYNIANNITLNNGTIVVVDGAQHLLGSLTVNSGGGYLITNFNHKDLFLDGGVSGSGALVIDNLAPPSFGDGQVHFSGTNSYSGTMTINASSPGYNGGRISVDSNNALQNAAVVMNGTRGMGLTATAPVFGSLSGTGAIALPSGVNLRVGNSTSSTYSGALTGAGSLTKSGTGTWTLTGANAFAGTTTITAGTVTAAASTGGALASTSAITVNSGGTLLLGASNQINNTAGLTLAGGTFAKGNFSEGTIAAAGLGALTLTASGSHLDFGSGTFGVLSFVSFTPGVNTLAIDNWTGTANTVGSAATDRLIFDTSQSAGNLTSFSFTGYQPGAMQFDLGNGFYEVTPVTPVPEPATYFAGALALFALGYHQRRTLRRLRKPF